MGADGGSASARTGDSGWGAKGDSEGDGRPVAGSGGGANVMVGLDPDLWNEWSLQTYLMRYHFISLDAYTQDLHWYITAKEGAPPVPTHYAPSGIELHGLTLWVLRADRDRNDAGAIHQNAIAP